MPSYGYSGPGMAVGAMSNALGDFFKKQLEAEQQIPQLQQTMANVGQMQRQGQMQEAMLPAQLQQAKQGIQKGALELEHMPTQYAQEAGRFGFQQQAAGREAEQYERQKAFQWPFEEQQRKRLGEAMTSLKDAQAAQGGKPLSPEQLNQWIVNYGDVLGSHPLAKNYHVYDPALQRQREAHAKYYEFLAGGGGANKPMTPAQNQTALSNARRQAELTTQSKLKEFGLFNPAQLGNLAERADAYDWLVDNEYRKILGERQINSSHLAPQRPMPAKLRQLMTQPEDNGGVFGVIGNLWNKMFGAPQRPPMQFTPQPEPAAVPEAQAPVLPAQQGWDIQLEK